MGYKPIENPVLIEYRTAAYPFVYCAKDLALRKI